MPDPLTSEIDTTPARPVCPSCILPISKHDDFCQNCFAPVGLTASIDPLKSIWAEGFLYKKAANDRITGFMLLSLWLILLPMILQLLFLLNEGIGQLVKGRLEFPDSYFGIIMGLGAILPGLVLYKITKNYLRTRAARQRADVEED